MADSSHWVHDLDPFAVQFGPDAGIRWYGLAYLAGFLIGWWLMGQYWRRGRSPLNPDQISTLVTAMIIGVMGGGRLGWVFLYAFDEFLDDPMLLFRIWEGGMASHGGFIGVMLALWWVARRYQISWLRLGDLIVSVVPVGLMLGRIANFINGELWGRVSQVPWAVIFPQSAPPGTPLALIAPRHPSQLYEAALEGVLLLAWTQWRLWRTRGLERPGRIGAEFLVLYAIVRIIGEQFREPDAPLIGGISRGAFYSIFLLIAGGVIWWISARRPPLPLPGKPG